MSKINLKDNIYKISISIIFGFLGFFINFHTIIFPFGEYTAATLLGLLISDFGILIADLSDCRLWNADLKSEIKIPKSEIRYIQNPK